MATNLNDMVSRGLQIKLTEGKGVLKGFLEKCVFVQLKKTQEGEVLPDLHREAIPKCEDYHQEGPTSSLGLPSLSWCGHLQE